MNPTKDQCDCCGTCCRNGGPPLHVQDIHLIRSGVLVFDDLVTVRRGELVLPPLFAEPEPATAEWIKIQGGGGEWCCKFLDPSSNSCKIYIDRPVSCKALKCWDTDDILAMAGRDLLKRSDLIDSNDPLLPLVKLQEKNCPLPDMENINAVLKKEEQCYPLLGELKSLVESDLHIRTQAAREFNITVARELFYFGRPLFQLLHSMGIVTIETPHGIELNYKPH